MRVVDVAEFYSPTGGGVRTYIDRKFKAAAQMGHELFVIAPGAADGFEPRGGGGVIQVKSPRLPFDANYHMFWDAAPVHRWLDELSPDLVEASSPWRGAWIVANWQGPVARAMFMHADPVASYPQRWLAPIASPEQIDQLFGWFWFYLRNLTGHFASVVTGGGWLAERLEGQGVEAVTSVPLGIDRGAFSPALRDESLRARLLQACGCPENAKLILGVGRFHPEKRWPMVIEAVTRASAATPIGLVLIGDGIDRVRVARAAAGNPHVRVLPPIHDRPLLAAHLASADALVHGCESETFGLLPAEAMASGLPVVGPDRGGFAHLARPATSEIYRSGDVQAAAAAIGRLLARDAATLKAAAVAAATGVRGDMDHFADLFDHYQRVSLQTRPARARAPIPSLLTAGARP
ncbi:glycosyltransferase [Caulobacter sp. RHG1]|uniref:glycosyltransferase n=1 Tax=Caulobacter sp. (strain RHG1) TaxID=2545762 RepID=UPI001555D9A9|nr:glycosyltransferase [Caulobacter sp. RHG1]NQE61705.1 Glycosyl transferase, group 1 family protein [Caulobacter sp. RHG1]